MRFFNLVQVELTIEEKILKYPSTISILYFIFMNAVIPDPEDSRTHIVRHANMSKNRMTPVALPVQNQGAGDVLRLWDTTFDAYSTRLVVSMKLSQLVPFCLGIEIGLETLTGRPLNMVFKFSGERRIV